jgi:RNA recognition motif-containing protein
MHIYIGKLNLKVTGKKLRKLFSKYGTVTSANVYQDRFREDSEAMGFVEMPNEDEAKLAVEKLNGYSLKGVMLEVHPARSRDTDRRSGLECRSDTNRRKKKKVNIRDNRSPEDRRKGQRRSGSERRKGFRQQ